MSRCNLPLLDSFLDGFLSAPQLKIVTSLVTSQTPPLTEIQKYFRKFLYVNFGFCAPQLKNNDVTVPPPLKSKNYFRKLFLVWELNG